jgi:hypothetical protein
MRQNQDISWSKEGEKIESKKGGGGVDYKKEKAYKHRH